MPLELSPVRLFFLDGAGNRPLGPAARVVDGPLGQVQVERPDRDQALPIVQPWDVDGDLLPGLRRNRLLFGAQSLFPGGGDLVGQAEAVDAGMVDLQVLPESRPQRAREAFHAGVVQRRLTLPQIVHQHITDRTADEAVSVDQFLGCARSSGAPYLPQRRRRVWADDTCRAQQPVEHGGVPGHRCQRVEFDVQQLQDVPDGDVGQQATLGRDDLGGAIQGVAVGDRGDVGIRVAQDPQPGEPVGVTRLCQVTHQASRACRFGHQPTQRGAHEICADRHQQRRGQRFQPPFGDQAVLLQPSGRDLAPSRACGVGSAGKPALLPGPARLGLQPVQQKRQPSEADLLGVGVVHHKRCAGQSIPHRVAALTGGRPGPRRRPGRETNAGRVPPCRRSPGQ
ncbi:hypothetical protein MLGJGCBP_03846 [Rhodococcus sp. T7]|nr:hypothetical protein MLGJGCBP_03846 [Rhodococcus sp. T7]